MVTPSFNQGRFLERTIQSVLSQTYEHFEYIIIDGGSHDETTEILRRYSSRLKYWVSEPDRGQAHALNKGFAVARGEILCFINSDDLLVAQALSTAVRHLSARSEVDFLCGRVDFIDEADQQAKGFPQLFEVAVFDDRTMLEACHVAQPATFFRAKAFRSLQGFDETLRYGFDYGARIRAYLAGFRFESVPDVLARFRLHSTSKTVGSYLAFVEEGIELYKRVLSRSGISAARRRALRRGMGATLGNLFVHLERADSTKRGRGALWRALAGAPYALLSAPAWTPLLLSLAPGPVRRLWRLLRNRYYRAKPTKPPRRSGGGR